MHDGEEDGMEYDGGTIEVSAIREDQRYGGLGVTPPMVKNCTLRNQPGFPTLSRRNLPFRSPASFLK